MEKRTKVYYEEHLRDLAQNPTSLSAYEGVKAGIKEMISNWEDQNKIDKEKNRNNDQGLKILKYFQSKLEFLEAQEQENYEEMSRLAADLNPNWLAIVSKPVILNCGRPDPIENSKIEKWWKWAKDAHREESAAEWSKNHPHFKMDFICPKKWDQMIPTGNNKVRFCEDCQKNVYFCDNIVEARELGYQGNCIGIDVGVPSKEENLNGESVIFGNPSKETIQNEKDRVKPDVVSKKRLDIEYEAAMKGHHTQSAGSYSPEYMEEKGDECIS